MNVLPRRTESRKDAPSARKTSGCELLESIMLLILIGLLSVMAVSIVPVTDASADTIAAVKTPRILHEKKIILLATNTLKKPVVIVGKLTDKSGQPLLGVNVTVKGALTGTMTDHNGFYRIELDHDYRILIFSYTGMKSQEISVVGKTTINVTMESESIDIEEVV